MKQATLPLNLSAKKARKQVFLNQIFQHLNNHVPLRQPMLKGL